MPQFMVELHGEVRELYLVEADTAEEAEERWSESPLYLSEASGMEIYSVTEESYDG